MRTSLGVVIVWIAAAACAAAAPDRPVPLILDTDMSGDCDDAGTLAMLHALADLGACDLLAVVTNRRDLANASAAAADAINSFYGRPDLPLGVGREPPTALRRTSPFTPALREERSGTVIVDEAGLTRWQAHAGGRQVLAHRACDPRMLARRIESLMIAPPAKPTAPADPAIRPDRPSTRSR